MPELTPEELEELRERIYQQTEEHADVLRSISPEAAPLRDVSPRAPEPTPTRRTRPRVLEASGPAEVSQSPNRLERILESARELSEAGAPLEAEGAAPEWPTRDLTSEEAESLSSLGQRARPTVVEPSPDVSESAARLRPQQRPITHRPATAADLRRADLEAAGIEEAAPPAEPIVDPGTTPRHGPAAIPTAPGGWQRARSRIDRMQEEDWRNTEYRRLLSEYQQHTEAQEPVPIGRTARGRARSQILLQQRNLQNRAHMQALAGQLDILESSGANVRGRYAIDIQEGQLTQRGRTGRRQESVAREEAEATRAQAEANRQQAQANVERRASQRDEQLAIQREGMEQRGRRRGAGGGRRRPTTPEGAPTLDSPTAPDSVTQNYVRNQERGLGEVATPDQRTQWASDFQEQWQIQDSVGRRAMVNRVSTGAEQLGRQTVMLERRQTVQIGRSLASNQEISRAVGHVIDWEEQLGPERMRTAVRQLNAIQPGDPIPEGALNADAQELRARVSGVINRELLDRSGAAVTDTEWARYRSEIGNFRTSDPQVFMTWFHRFNDDLTAAKSVLQGGFMPNSIAAYYSQLDPSAGGQEQGPGSFTRRTNDGTEVQFEDSDAGRLVEEQLRNEGVIQ